MVSKHHKNRVKLSQNLAKKCKLKVLNKDEEEEEEKEEEGTQSLTLQAAQNRRGYT